MFFTMTIDVIIFIVIVRTNMLGNLFSKLTRVPSKQRNPNHDKKLIRP